MTDTMTPRERFQALMHFSSFDRLPLVEWAHWWDQTVTRWHGDGLPAEVTDRYDLCRHFGLELYVQEWFSAMRPGFPQPASHGAGVLTSMSEYEAMLEHLYPQPAINPDVWDPWLEAHERGEVVLWFTLEGFFWQPRVLLGIQRHFYAFNDQPELLHRINADLADWLVGAIEEICAKCTPDFVTFAEDMSYNHGAMLSKEHFEEFVTPYYQRVVPHLQERGILSIVDSDGDISVPAYWFEDAGLDGILPLERQAGVDMDVLRADHPRMRFIGHFDKMVMHRGEAALRAEFERLLPVAAKGGFIVSCDHQTPPGVSYQDYQLFLSLFREYGTEAGRMSRELDAGP